MFKAKTLLIFIALLALNLAFAQDTNNDGGFVEADAHEHGAALVTLAIEGDTLALDFISPSFNIVGFEYAPKTEEEKAMVNKALLNLGNTSALMSFSNRANCSMVSSNIVSEMSEGDGHEGHDDHHGEDEHHDDHHDEHSEDGEHHEGEEHHDDHKDDDHHEGEEHHEGEDEHHEGEEHHDEEHHDDNHHGEDGHHDEDKEGDHHEGEEHHDEEHHEGEEHHDEEHHDDEHKEDDHHEGEEHDDHDHGAEGEVHSEFHASYEFSCANMNRLDEIDFSGLFAAYPNVEDLDLQYVTEDTQGAVELNPSQTVLKF